MFVFLNQYFLLVNLFFLLFVFSFITIFHITTVESLNDQNDFFEISPENYYDPRDYGEEIPFSEQFDKETTTSIDNDNNNNNNTRLSTITDKYGKSTTTTTKTINYLDENYSGGDINFIAAGDWNCNKETKKTIIKMTKLEPELIIGLGDY